jgi:hypothetical protein
MVEKRLSSIQIKSIMFNDSSCDISDRASRKLIPTNEVGGNSKRKGQNRRESVVDDSIGKDAGIR